jgi:methanogenic corrinoid protein MtbC1
MENMNSKIANHLRELDDSFAKKILEKQFEAQPSLKAKYRDKQIHHYIEDTKFHLSYLSQAIANNEPVLFNEYLAWAKTFFNNLPVTDEEIIVNLELLRDEIEMNLPDEMSATTNKYIDEGIKYYKAKSPVIPSFISEANPQKEIAEKYLNFLIEGDKASAHSLIMDAVQNGTSIKDLYLNVFQITQKETGRLWQISKISVAHEHFITAATQLIMAQLYPYMFTSTNKENRIIVTCINGELHEIGARMVADIFEMEGWNSYYFGANTPLNSVLESINTYKPQILAVSTTMTFNLSSVSTMIEKVKSETEVKNLKILVGGYPFLIADKLWQNIGADGFAPDAISAVKLAEQIVNT